MKRYLIILIIIITSYSHAKAQESNNFKIEGDIIGIPENTGFFLIKSNQGRADTVSRTVSKNGKFSFLGKLKIIGEPYFLKIDTTQARINNKISYITLIMDTSPIYINGAIQNWPEVTINGSPATIDYWELISIGKRVKAEHRQDVNDSTSRVKARETYNRIIYELAYSKPNSFVSAYAIYCIAKTINKNELMDFYNKLTPRVRSSYFGLKLDTQLKAINNRSLLKIGARIPDFQIETINGDKVSILNLVKTNDYTLIDFWAYWCTPCRADTPNMKEVYNKFNKHGFGILSISTDLNKEKWRKAITEDETTWVHGLDLDNSSKLLFDIGSIPAYILVNKAGEMIAVDCGISGFSKNKPTNYMRGMVNGSAANIEIVDASKKGLRNDLNYVIDSLINKKM